MAAPKLLLMDEPSMGLSPIMVGNIVLGGPASAVAGNERVKKAYLGG
jgi:ABC-type branched-subunit amino acid transport system ATPase component